ncbi:MAG: hypothetical protein ACI8YQ_000103 [Polaribacter sp.]|jgi:hypothetical protein
MKKPVLHAEKTSKGRRNFYFDIKDTKDGQNFMAISSVSLKEEGQPERSQLIIFENEMDGFAGAFMRSLLNFEKKEAMRG